MTRLREIFERRKRVFGVSALLAALVADARAETTLWEAPVTPAMRAAGDYEAAVEALVAAFEARAGWTLAPGEHGRVGLKIYTESGPGLATPVPLVKAMVAALERRGFAKERIFLVGLNQLRLREAGYLPSLTDGRAKIEGHPVFVLESGRFYDPVWFYDSPLPSRFDPVLAERSGAMETSGRSEFESATWSAGAAAQRTAWVDDRKSLLATPLFLQADFWINLPVYTDHAAIGVNGALANATLWNASNTARFLRSEASAPAAVAEMSAIPELRLTWAFTLTSLERYQFIGGPQFNSLYTAEEPRLWLGTDPVMMDAHLLAKMNAHREARGFKPVSAEIRTLEFAEKLGVGTRTLVEPKPVSAIGRGDGG